MKRSKKLTKFYKDYYAWLMKGAPKHKQFSRDFGLCSAVNDAALEEELAAEFTKAGLHELFPFNNRKNADFTYADECIKETCHLNKCRREWVRNRARVR